MENQTPKKITRSFLRSFRALRDENMNPDFSWKVIIIFTVIVITGLTILATFSYQWASEINTPVLSAKKTASASISSEEIHRVINLYNEKKKQYELLLITPPPAPSLEGGIATGGTTTPLTEEVADIIVVEDVLVPEIVN